MDDKRQARVLARYNAWANRMIFDAVEALPEGEALKPRPGAFRNIVHTLNHNYVIDRIFQAHLEGREHGYTARNTAEHPALAELRRAQEAIDAWYIARYDAMAAAALDEVIRFTFVGGGAGAMTRAEILLHVVNHTTYHRGNVASAIYQIPGCRPPTTDLPVFLRDVPQA
jgi:uncharacterized damage-inducible protein DinB